MASKYRKWSDYDNRIKPLIGTGLNPSQIASKVFPDANKLDRDSLIRRVKTVIKKVDSLIIGLNNNSETSANDYTPHKSNLSAMKPDGSPMSIDEYCAAHGFDRAMVSSSKFISHNGTAFYNIVFKDAPEEDKDYSEIYSEIQNRIKKIKKGTRLPNRGRTGLVVISDIHMGAWIKNIDNCPDFDIDILTDKLIEISDRINTLNYDNVVVSFLGDYVEGVFSKHKNSWQGMENGLFGAEMIITATELLSTALLERINNLQEIKMISGNHDCLTVSKDDDPDYGAGMLLAYGLKLKGYNVKHNNHVNSFEIGEYSFITHHGDHFRKATPESMVLRFGVQGKQNIILSGHLHSRAMKSTKAFQEVDSADVRVYKAPSIFTGNTYSSNLGFTSTSGFMIFEPYKGGLSVTDFTIK